jgi:hypothetical protein
MGKERKEVESKKGDERVEALIWYIYRGGSLWSIDFNASPTDFDIHGLIGYKKIDWCTSRFMHCKKDGKCVFCGQDSYEGEYENRQL